MAVINVLDDKTIDKIAAGEVIERPASVIKELVENSIDSGANAITIEIKEGGISYMRVTDNGCGIEKSQIRNAFMRHATSKIKDVMDLFKISSLGFRGEALSSISAVSSVELLSKTADDFSGVRYVVTGGREEVLEDAGIPDGTTIVVRNLFYNTPARLKFLKSANTEASHITDLVQKLILSHPEIAFKYMINGTDRLLSPGNGDVSAAIYAVFGRDAAFATIPADFQNDNVHITGYIGKPEISRGNRNCEFFFVNNRCIKSTILSNALEAGYGNRLMQHKYPFAVLYLEIDPARLDINVHPAKTEIKFFEEALLYNFLQSEVEKCFSKTEIIPQVRAESKLIKENIPSENRQTVETNAPEPIKTISAASHSVSHTISHTAPEPFEVLRKEQIENTDDKPLVVSNYKTVQIEKSEQMNLFEENFISEAAVKHHNIIGQIFDTYWLVEYDKSLYIIDQHAAHEKVLYERFMKRFKENTISTQQIYPPVIISLTVQEEDTLKQFGDNLSQMGFEWEHFGGHEYSLRGVPLDLFEMTNRDYFISVLDDLSEGRQMNPEAVNDRIATMACKAAIKGNMHISKKEASALIEELLTLENPYNCPHGRPCIISYSKAEIEKLFKRIV